jgi:class 3 adenylate cyclase
LVALSAATAVQLPLLDRADGLSIDSLFWVRHQVFGPLRPATDSPTVVIAVDEETYRRHPFQDIPKAMWTPHLAKVLEATLDAGALVIGQDLILPTSVERYLKGHDRSYLLALRRGARDKRLILGKVQHLRKPLSPFPGHSFAVGHQRNIRLVNLFRDVDGVIRRIPLIFRGTSADGQVRVETSMALELAARALGELPAIPIAGGPIDLAGNRIPGSGANAMLLNFETGGGDIPTYSLADLYHCAEAVEVDFYAKHFKDKVVIVGGVLDVEDRKLTSKRYVTGPEKAWTRARCVLPVMENLYDERVVRDTVPGVYVFATAVNNLLRGDALRQLPGIAEFLILLLAAFGAGAAGLKLRPAPSAMATAAALGVWLVVATAVFRFAVVLPMIDGVLVAVTSLVIVAGYRFGITDREKRAMRRAFAYYLPDPVIDRMLAKGAKPELGGETRDVTVVFSDIADFTAQSENMAPADVVALMNRYLSAMTDVIEAHGGFVDKYIGDAILAVFGAPLDDTKHARHAVDAALACQEKLSELEPQWKLPAGRQLVARIGISSGPVLIGNIGGKKRFNYTVMGDTVNLASRLEGVNKLYGTKILASAETAERCRPAIAFREIERVRVLGRAEAVVLYEPLGREADRTSDERAWDTAFSKSGAAFRAKDHAAAKTSFEGLAFRDPVARKMAERCQELIDDPPPPGWDGTRNLDRK